VIRLILENGLRIRLLEAFVAAADALYPEWRTSPELNAALADTPGTEWQQRLSYVPVEVLNFVADRLKVHLRERGVRHDLISAVFYNPIRRIEAHLGFGEREDDLLRLLACVDALSSFLDTDDGKNLLIAYRRASNIVEIEEDRDGKDYHQLPEAALFQQSEEKNVFDRLSEISSTLETLLQQEQFIDAMQRLATLRQPVDEFFEKVTVNTERRDLRSNRLKLLSYIRDTMNRVADFSQIEG
jgi:glycyl-tRNA synthetase beta chain